MLGFVLIIEFLEGLVIKLLLEIVLASQLGPCFHHFKHKKRHQIELK